jgi:hypothetical protein
VGTGQTLVAGQIRGNRQAKQIKPPVRRGREGHIPPSAATIAERHDRADRGRSERWNERSRAHRPLDKLIG